MPRTQQVPAQISAIFTRLINSFCGFLGLQRLFALDESTQAVIFHPSLKRRR